MWFVAAAAAAANRIAFESFKRRLCHFPTFFWTVSADPTDTVGPWVAALAEGGNVSTPAAIQSDDSIRKYTHRLLQVRIGYYWFLDYSCVLLLWCKHKPLWSIGSGFITEDSRQGPLTCASTASSSTTQASGRESDRSFCCTDTERLQPEPHVGPASGYHCLVESTPLYHVCWLLVKSYSIIILNG